MGKNKQKKKEKPLHHHDDDDSPALPSENLEDLLMLDEEETKTLSQFRGEYEKELASGAIAAPKGAKARDGKYDDDMLLKFLRAKKWDLGKSMKVLKNYSEWYNSVGDLTIEHVRAVLEKEIILFPGTKDKDGYFILYMRPALFFPSLLPTPELMQAVVYLLERIIEEQHVQVHGFTFIADMQNWGWANFEVNYARQFMQTMENRFPARLRKFILIDPPSWFNLVWVIIRPMFSAKFASKWHFMTRETIGDQVDGSQRFPDTGGSFDFSMAKFVEARYTAEGIPYSDAYLTKDPTAADSVFAPKAEKE